MRLSNHDEFYTQYDTIAEEMDKHVGFFTGKVIYLPCDNPCYSMFWTYFRRTFYLHRFKSLIATFYQTGRHPYLSEFDGFHLRFSELRGDGNFLSSECLEIASRSDIVVMNPPFSKGFLFDEALISRHIDFIQIIPRWALAGQALKFAPFPLYTTDSMSSLTEYLVPSRFCQQSLDSCPGRYLSSGDRIVKVDTAWMTSVPFPNARKIIPKERRF